MFRLCFLNNRSLFLVPYVLIVKVTRHFANTCTAISIFQMFENFTFLYTFYWRRQWHPTPVLLPGKSPWMEEPGRLQSMGSLRVRRDWATSLSLFTFMHWRRKWQPTPVFLPGESQGQGSLVGCRPWGRTE